MLKYILKKYTGKISIGFKGEGYNVSATCGTTNISS
jgi:hypothetical protein